MSDDSAILKKVISGDVIQMPVGIDHRKILDAVFILQVFFYPLTLAGQIHGINDDGGITPVYCMHAAAQPHIHLIMVLVTAPVKIKDVVINFYNFNVIYFLSDGFHGVVPYKGRFQDSGVRFQIFSCKLH